MRPPLQALAGILDPRAGRSDTDGRRVAAAAFDGGRKGEVVAAGPLVAAGPAPRSGRSGAVASLLDGRIHNLAALARELGLDEEARTADVLATAWRRWGAGLAERLRGGFGLLVWDTERRAGVLAQDQVGPKAVYLASAGERLVFASELRTLLALLPSRPGPDERTILRMLSNDLIEPHSTPFAGIERLGSGYLLELDESGRRRRRYWQPVYRPPLRLTRAEAAESLWESARAAVRSRVGEDERIGILASGGVDSTFVTAATAAALDDAPARVRTYSAVFPGDEDLDESANVDRVTEALGLGGVQVRVEPGGVVALALDYLSVWEDVLPGPGWLLEQPLIGLAADAGVDVFLDGQGGDEVLGDSPFLLADRLARGRVISSLRLARRLPIKGGRRGPWKRALRRWKTYAVKGAVPYGLHRALLRRKAADGRRADWVSAQAADRIDPRGVEPPTWKRRPRGVPRWWSYQAELLTRVREDYGLHDYVRRRAALAGIEARPPLLDVDLVETSLRLPPEHSIDPLNRPLARDAMKGLVPDEVRLSPRKTRLSPFYFTCFAGPDLAALRRLLGDHAEVRAYARADVLREWLDSPPRIGEPGWENWLTGLWCTVTVETFLRRQADPHALDAVRAELDPGEPRWRVHREWASARAGRPDEIRTP